MSLAPGTVMFKVFAYANPKQKLEGKRGELIGRIVVTSKITTSLWGDQTLFFKHQRMDDDLKFHPEWKPYLQTWNNGKMNETALANPPPAANCPFKFLFGVERNGNF